MSQKSTSIIAMSSQQESYLLSIKWYPNAQISAQKSSNSLAKRLMLGYIPKDFKNLHLLECNIKKWIIKMKEQRWEVGKIGWQERIEH
jgi:hypothetical protein